ncbi:MAG: hypothetical protein JST54_10725 [Deltaproteobacteria bacterium]|nr:hypothetical protein [Deltaproteobacteria bacterium]
MRRIAAVVCVLWVTACTSGGSSNNGGSSGGNNGSGSTNSSTASNASGSASSSTTTATGSTGDTGTSGSNGSNASTGSSTTTSTGSSGATGNSGSSASSSSSTASGSSGTSGSTVGTSSGSTGGSGCTINGTSYPDGTYNPANPCELCDSSSNPSGWANEVDGIACTPAGGGLAYCLSGACNACKIGGTLYADGAVNPNNACEVCTAAVSTSAWSPGNEGANCDDGNLCNGVSTCSTGTCTQTTPPVDCSVAPTCYSAVGASCDTTSGQCQFVAENPGTACGTGTDGGVDHVCDGLGGCVACTAGGACAPTNACHLGAYSCSTGAAVCTDTGTNAPDGTNCGPNAYCNGGSCQTSQYVLTVLVGDAQTVSVDQPLSPITLKLADTGGTAVPGVTVTLAAPAGVALSPTTGVTSGLGRVTFTPTLGLAASDYAFTATAPGAQPLVIHATANAVSTGNIFTAVDVAHASGNSGAPGPATAAQIYSPSDLAVASDGTVYFADSNNHMVKRISPQGVISVVAGTGSAGYSGDLGAATSAKLYYPTGVALDEPNGQLYIGDTYNNVVRVVDLASHDIYTFAGGGTAPGPGYGDNGPASNAALSYPSHLLVDPVDSSVYVADTGHNRIRRINPISTVISLVVQSDNSSCGLAFGACGGSISGCTMALDGLGNLFFGSQVSCNYYYAVSRVPKTGGTPVLIAGGNSSSGGSTAEGISAMAAYIASIPNLAFDPAGNLFLSIASANTVRRIEGGNGRITTVAGTGSAGFSGDYGVGTSAQLSAPSAIAFDPSNSLWISDASNNAIRVLAGAGTSVPSVSTLSVGSGDLQTPLVDQLPLPIGAKLVDANNSALRGFNVLWASVDPGGALYSSSALTNNSGISLVSVRPGLAVQSYHFAATFFDIHGQPVAGSPATFTVTAQAPSAGTLFTAVNVDHASGNTGVPGPATAAHVAGPIDFATASDGTFYFADYRNQMVRKVSPQGQITTVAGNGTASFSGDQGPATGASLYYPYGVALDEARGQLYIADSSNGRIRQVDLASGIISTLAGGGSVGGPGYGDNGPATAANLSGASHILVDPADGSVFIADTGHNRIRRVDPVTGIITSVIVANGSGCNQPFLGCGGADGCSMALDSTGNLYFSANNYSACNQTPAVMRIPKTGGAPTVVAGGVTSSGPITDGTVATSLYLQYLPYLAISPAGELHMSFISTNRVRRINAADQKVYTVVGDGTANFAGDYGAATAAELNAPYGIAFTGGGHLVIADYGNNAVRYVW